MKLTTPIEINIPGLGTIESADLYLKQEVDEILNQKDNEINKLKKALWIARANSAQNAAGEIHNVIAYIRLKHPTMSLSNTEAQEQIWKDVERKCRVMAEKYK